MPVPTTGPLCPPVCPASRASIKTSMWTFPWSSRRQSRGSTISGCVSISDHCNLSCARLSRVFQCTRGCCWPTCSAPPVSCSEAWMTAAPSGCPWSGASSSSRSRSSAGSAPPTKHSDQTPASTLWSSS